MNILLVAGGKKHTWPKLKKYDKYIGVDRGSFFLLEEDLPLDYAVGDFDSLTAEEVQRVKQRAGTFIQAPAEKDDTDTQLALLTAVEKYPDAKIDIIGATGGRMDHFLANLWLVMEERFQPFAHNIRIVDSQNIICFFLPGKYSVQRAEGMVYLAYCCLTPIDNLSLMGSKYVLSNVNVNHPTSYASNEFITDEASFSFEKGIMAVIQSKD
jgi:thiamine pyrophosphokinase